MEAVGSSGAVARGVLLTTGRSSTGITTVIVGPGPSGPERAR